MGTTPTEPPARDGKGIFFAVSILAAAALATVVSLFGSPGDFELYGLSVARGTFNQCTAILVTCIALVVPLTANLYSPRLVRLYVTHPLIVTGLSVLVVGQILLMVSVFFPRGTSLATPLAWTISALYLFVLVGALPFLYGVSQFLRPQFFMPMLTRNAAKELGKLVAGKDIAIQNRHLFEGIDVITNIALTGMNRGDRQLVLLSLRSLHGIFTQVIGSAATEGSVWQKTEPHFVPGLAREGRDYLLRERIWPEAYLIAQMLRIMESANARQHEILAELAAALLDTALLSFLLGRTTVLELHVMTFNSLMADSVQEDKLRKFQNLSYYYRLLVENFQDDTDQMLATARHLVHYGHTAHKRGMHFALETVVYDVGELVLNLARDDEDRALALVEALAGKLWCEVVAEEGLPAKVGWRCVVRVYWEARAAGHLRLAEAVHDKLLGDDRLHAEQIDRCLVNNRELHTEFNDRLMRFAWISDRAAALAREFAAASRT
jgi:hypothetical protein